MAKNTPDKNNSNHQTIGKIVVHGEMKLGFGENTVWDHLQFGGDGEIINGSDKTFQILQIESLDGSVVDTANYTNISKVTCNGEEGLKIYGDIH